MAAAIASSTNSTATSAHYRDLLQIYRSIESTLPHWNNPKYAYSGLHSIILPPPPELNLWGSVVIPIIQPVQAQRCPPPPECSFCFDNYSERVCQFYEPKKTDFQKVAERNGKTIVCECCDHSEGEEANAGAGEDAEGDSHVGGLVEGSARNDMQMEESIFDELSASRRRQSNELNEISNNLHRNGEESEEKAQKLQDEAVDNNQKENGKATAASVVQAGWYGKGYRKYRQQRRRKS